MQRNIVSCPTSKPTFICAIHLKINEKLTFDVISSHHRFLQRAVFCVMLILTAGTEFDAQVSAAHPRGRADAEPATDAARQLRHVALLRGDAVHRSDCLPEHRRK